MSESDIAAGSRWFYEVSDKLESCRIGLICVTPENQASPWLHFEAGALSKAVDISNICPIGFELSPGQISGPLSQFQSVELNEEGMLKVLSSLNKACAEHALPESELIEIFEVWWPKFDETLKGMPPSPGARPARSIEEQMEELLQLSREILRRDDIELQARTVKMDSLEKISSLHETFLSNVSSMSSSLSEAPQALFREIETLAASDEQSIDKSESVSEEELSPAMLKIQRYFDTLSSDSGGVIDSLSGIVKEFQKMNVADRDISKKLLDEEAGPDSLDDMVDEG
jgi:hypothetical protein